MAGRTNVPTKLKQQLVNDAGGKCANPGCTSVRTHIHHIHEWAAYRTHDGKHMLAVCPTCHDAIHSGALPISDQTVRRWKKIKRSGTGSDHVYIDPGSSSKVLLGSIASMGSGGVTVFDLGPANQLSFRVEGNDIMLLNLSIARSDGEGLLRIIDGHVRHAVTDPVEYERVPGHVRVTSPMSEDFVAGWILEAIRTHESELISEDDRLTLLDVEVLEPGLVRVQGVWGAPEHAIVITPTEIAFLDPNLTSPLSLRGAGAESVFYHAGPITTSLFGFDNQGPAVLHIPSTAMQPSPASQTPQIGRNDSCWCGSGAKFKKCHGA